MSDTITPPRGCLFCAYDRPDLNRVLAQNTTCYARYDNYPAAPGHIEVAPKRHVESFFDLTAQESADAVALLARARELVTAEHPCDGYTIGVNEGRAAGRTIDHVHIHLIPRTVGDVPDPRGGVRMVVSSRSPDEWTGVVGTKPEVVPPSRPDGHGTCSALVGRGAEGTATCGYEITLRAERTVLMTDGTDGHGQPGGRETLVWRHTDPAIDYMHTAQLGGPA